MRRRAFLNEEGLDAVEVELEKENDVCYSAEFILVSGDSSCYVGVSWEPLDSEEMKAAIGKILLVRDHLDALIAEYKLACIKEGVPSAI